MALTKVTYSMIDGAVVNALDYGVSTSKTAAENNTALQAALDTGMNVYLPTGEYAFSQITLGSQVLFGDGESSVLKLTSSPVATVITFGASNATISKLKINAPYAPNGVHLFLANAKQFITLSECFVEGWQGNLGFRMQNSYLIRVENCTFNPANAAIRFETCQYVWVDSNYFYTDSSSNPTGITSDPVYFENGGDLSITNNYIAGSCRDGIVLEGSNIQRFTISGNVVKNVDESGIWLETAHNLGTVSNNTVVGCNGLVYGLGNGITFNYSKDVSCVGNAVSDCTRGIWVSSGRVTITGNSVRSCNVGMYADGNDTNTDIILSGNLFERNEVGVSTNVVRNMSIIGNEFCYNDKNGIVFNTQINSSVIQGNNFRKNNTLGLTDPNVCSSIAFLTINYHGMQKVSVNNNTFTDETIGIRIQGNAAATGDYSSQIWGNQFFGTITSNYSFATDVRRLVETAPQSVLYDTAAPITGTWQQGCVVYNTAPTSGGYVGWVCTNGGAPGTWKTFGAIS